MATRPFALLGDAQLGSLSALLTKATEGWCSAWGVNPADLHVQCLRAWDSAALLPNMSWQCRYGSHDKMAWFAWQADFAKCLQRQLFGGDQRYLIESDAVILAADSATAALRALTEQVTTQLVIDSAATSNARTHMPDKHLFERGSGAVLTTIKLADQSLVCLLGHAAARAGQAAEPVTTSPRLPQVKLHDAVRDVPLSLPITLGCAEVDIGSLLMLSVGDVIRLDAPVNQAMAVSSSDGVRLFSGYLGALERDMAIEVLHQGKT